MSDDFRARVAAALAPAYALDRELAGGMSRVFVAVEQALGRTVVVKVLSPELSAGVNRDRFRREIQLAAQLQHPHIVPLLSAGERDDLLYYTMPYIEGESLRARLAERGPLPVRDVVRMLHDVVDALAYAHRRGVVHRDIKPANILVHGSHALVTDFGVAKALSASLPHSGTTSVGVAMGTPAYMAPEQLAADPAADHRVDLYAVGLVAYELLTGASPFTGPSPRETMAAQLTRMPEPLHVCCPDVPPALSAVVMRCLAKSPEARHPTADALLADLEAATSGPVAAGVAAGWSSGPHAAGAASGPTSGPTSGHTSRATSGPAAATTPGAGAPAAGPGSGAVAPTRARRWLVGGALLAAGLLAGAALAARWQAGRTGDPAPTVQALTAVGDTSRSISVAPIAEAPAPAARPLTRADSLAIAAAVRERVQAAQPAPPAAAGLDVDSLARVLQRLVADSVAYALRDAQRARTIVLQRGERFPDPEALARLERLGGGGGAPGARGPGPRSLGETRDGRGGGAGGGGGGDPRDARGGPVDATGRRRVLVADVRNTTGRRDLDETAAALSGALRGALEAGRVYDVVRASGRLPATGREAASVAARAQAGALVAPLLTRSGDSLSLQVFVTDVGRGALVGTLRSSAPAGGDPAAGLEALVGQVRGLLGAMSWTAAPAVPPAPATTVRIAPPAPPAPPPL